MPWLLPIAADDTGGLIFQIIFVLIMIVAWVVRAIAAAREKRAGGARPPKPPPPPHSGFGGDRPRQTSGLPADVVYGTRRLQHPPRPIEEKRRAQRASDRPPPTPKRRPTAKTRRPNRRALVKELHARDETAQARVRDAVRARRAALERLGVADVPGGMRARTRMGVLWSEVLGPPRAMRGPHRAPTFERRR